MKTKLNDLDKWVASKSIPKMDYESILRFLEMRFKTFIQPMGPPIFYGLPTHFHNGWLYSGSWNNNKNMWLCLPPQNNQTLTKKQLSCKQCAKSCCRYRRRNIRKWIHWVRLQIYRFRTDSEAFMQCVTKLKNTCPLPLYKRFFNAFSDPQGWPAQALKSLNTNQLLRLGLSGWLGNLE